MILLDTNVLVFAMYRESALYEASATLVDRALKERRQFCIAPQNLIEFMSVTTRSRFVTTPLDPIRASEIAEKLYKSRNLAKIYAARGTVRRALIEGRRMGFSGPVWYDLFLAQTMKDAGVRIIITDNTRDFLRFPFVTTQTIQGAESIPAPAQSHGSGDSGHDRRYTAIL